MRTAAEIVGPLLVIAGVATISWQAALVIAGLALTYLGSVQ
jgi:hypothetical protein